MRDNVQRAFFLADRARAASSMLRALRGGSRGTLERLQRPSGTQSRRDFLGAASSTHIKKRRWKRKRKNSVPREKTTTQPVRTKFRAKTVFFLLFVPGFFGGSMVNNGASAMWHEVSLLATWLSFFSSHLYLALHAPLQVWKLNNQNKCKSEKKS